MKCGLYLSIEAIIRVCIAIAFFAQQHYSVQMLGTETEQGKIMQSITRAL